MAKRKIDIVASTDPLSGEMTTSVGLGQGGINLPDKVKRKMKKWDNKDLSNRSEGEVLETVSVDEPGVNPFI